MEKTVEGWRERRRGGAIGGFGGSRKKIVNPAGMTADGRQQSKVQVTNKRIVCPEESPLPASVYDNYAVRRFAAGGLVRRLWLGSGIWCPMGFSPASVPEGFQRASGKPFGEPAGAYPFPRVGYDAPTTAREWDLPSYGALTLFFRWRKKSLQKKASGTALREKGFYCPF